jgi:hypothetical protein
MIKYAIQIYNFCNDEIETDMSDMKSERCNNINKYVRSCRGSARIYTNDKMHMKNIIAPLIADIMPTCDEKSSKVLSVIARVV